MKETLFDLSEIKQSTHTCNQCKFFYRKQHEYKNKSWGKCELGKSSYDAPAKKSACAAFQLAESPDLLKGLKQ